jgi:hypothetical protein
MFSNVPIAMAMTRHKHPPDDCQSGVGSETPGVTPTALPLSKIGQVSAHRA